MIVKSFELNKIDFMNKYLFLLYGENQGHKNQVIEEKFKRIYSGSIYYYEESEIINNQNNFFNNILSKSFFEDQKLIIINRASDKIINIIEEITDKKISDLVLVLNANTLEKKSKLRTFFEKNNETICIPFYEDNSQTLTGLVNKFFRDNNIPISQQAMNLIVERCRGDRQNLVNELKKVEGFIINKKKN